MLVWAVLAILELPLINRFAQVILQAFGEVVMKLLLIVLNKVDVGILHFVFVHRYLLYVLVHLIHEIFLRGATFRLLRDDAEFLFLR